MGSFGMNDEKTNRLLSLALEGATLFPNCCCLADMESIILVSAGTNSSK